MKYIKGDIIELADSGNYDVVFHGCNCQNTMGSGVAKALRDRWPEIYEADCKTPKGSPFKLGQASVANVLTKSGKTIRIFNAYTQYNYLPRGVLHFEYGALISFLYELEELLQPGQKVLIPKIGSGLAGGDWTIIEGILNQFADTFDVNITCCYLEN